MSSTRPVTAPKQLPPLCMHPRLVCSGGCLPGQCKNGRCPFRMHGQMMWGRPEVEEEHDFRRRCLQKARDEIREREKIAPINAERKAWGLNELSEEEIEEYLKKRKKNQIEDGRELKNCPVFDKRELESPERRTRTMRPPARPLCQLETPEYSPPHNDYAELSRFLRISTMPGYSDNNNVSEYKDTHNMAVWNNRREKNQTLFNMKQDWLSNWGEFNVKEQRWRKAWVEKFGGEANSK